MVVGHENTYFLRKEVFVSVNGWGVGWGRTSQAHWEGVGGMEKERDTRRQAGRQADRQTERQRHTHIQTELRERDEVQRERKEVVLLTSV